MSQSDRGQTLTPSGEAPSVWFLEGSTLLHDPISSLPIHTPLMHSIIGVGNPSAVRAALKHVLQGLRAPASSPVSSSVLSCTSSSSSSSSSASSSSSSPSSDVDVDTDADAGLAPPLLAVSHSELCRRLSLALQRSSPSPGFSQLSFAVLSVASADPPKLSGSSSARPSASFARVSCVDCAGAIRPVHRPESSSSASPSRSVPPSSLLHLSVGAAPVVRAARSLPAGASRAAKERFAVAMYRAKAEREANAGGGIVMYCMGAERGGEVVRKVFGRNCWRQKVEKDATRKAVGD